MVRIRISRDDGAQWITAADRKEGKSVVAVNVLPLRPSRRYPRLSDDQIVSLAAIVTGRTTEEVRREGVKVLTARRRAPAPAVRRT